METVELTIKKTSINLISVLAWFAFWVGVIAAMLQVNDFTGVGAFCAAAGLLSGGIAATYVGPIRTVTFHKVRGRKIELRDSE